MDEDMELRLPDEVEAAGKRVIGCAIEVHKRLGPGLLESLYEDAFCYELKIAGLRVERQKEIAIPYRDMQLHGQRLDLVIEDSIIVELKSVSKLLDVHGAQLLSYPRATGLPLGFLFNFNVTWMREGLKRIVNERSARCLPPLDQHPLSPSSSLS
jgi:GxxExxY protein